MSLPISVLITTYGNETAGNLTAALESVYTQTELPLEIVLVVDGPIASDQEDVIATYAADARIGRLEVVRLHQRTGHAGALNAGLSRCACEFIARMDSDDICVPDRLSEQWRLLQRFPDVDVVGSWSEEFEEDPAVVTALKTPPERHEDIIRALSWRNVLVHPSILLRKELTVRVGGWRQTRSGFYSDYEFYIRLALAGGRFYMIQQPLIKFRISRAQRRRRSGYKYAIDEFNIRRFSYRSGFISLPKFLLITPIYCLFRLVSPGIKRYLYRFVRLEPGRAKSSARAN